MGGRPKPPLFPNGTYIASMELNSPNLLGNKTELDSKGSVMLKIDLIGRLPLPR